MDDREFHEVEDRRKVLISAGRFAAVTPPAITLAAIDLSDLRCNRAFWRGRRA